MLNRRNILALAAALAVAAVAVLYSQRGNLAASLMDGQLDDLLGRDLAAELPDGLHLAVCGAGGPLPDPVRSGPCLAVIAGESLLVFDAGTNSPRVMQRMQLSPGDIDALFLTHYHSDHIDGLGEMALMRWTTGAAAEPLDVHGPGDSLLRVVRGFNMAYGMDHGYRAAHHGDAVAPASGAGMRARAFEPPGADGMQLVWESDAGAKVWAFRVDHEPVEPAVGYRVDYKGRSLLISGDTNEKTRIHEWAKGVDLLAHEALSDALVGILGKAAARVGRPRAAKIMADIPSYHTTPVEAAKIAQRAGARHLLFHHVIPPLILPGLDARFLQGVDDHYDGPVTLSVDGTLVVMPADGDDIEVESLLH